MRDEAVDDEKRAEAFILRPPTPAAAHSVFYVEETQSSGSEAWFVGKNAFHVSATKCGNRYIV